MAYTVLIPARLASSRLPNKPLADLGGVPMVVRVAQRVRDGLAVGTRIVVAGDSPDIVQACAQYQIEAVLTHQNHVSGSDRLAQACDLLGLDDAETVVNVQGDEPLIDPVLVDHVARLLQDHPLASMGTAAHPLDQVADYLNPNVVKVVLDATNHALYFSRAPIPFLRDPPAGTNLPALPQPAPLRHIGIYSYRVGFLLGAGLKRIHPEALEQLRALWHGHRIAVHITPTAPGPGVDTPDDLTRVRALFTNTAAL